MNLAFSLARQPEGQTGYCRFATGSDGFLSPCRAGYFPYAMNHML